MLDVNDSNQFEAVIAYNIAFAAILCFSLFLFTIKNLTEDPDIFIYFALFGGIIIILILMLTIKEDIIYWLYPAGVLFMTLDETTTFSLFKVIGFLCVVAFILEYLKTNNERQLIFSSPAMLLVIVTFFMSLSYLINRSNIVLESKDFTFISRIFLVLLPIVMANLLRGKDRLRRFVAIGAISTSIGVFYASLGSEYLFGSEELLNRTFGDRTGDSISAMALIMLPIVAYLAINAETRLKKLIWVWVGAILIFGIILTFRRMGFLLLLCFLAMLVKGIKRTKMKVFVLGLGAIIIGTFIIINSYLSGGSNLSLTERLDTLPLVGSQTENINTAVRAEMIYPTAIQVFLDHPWWGVGLENFDAIARQYEEKLNRELFWPQKEPVYSHNIALELLTAQGIFVAFFLLSALSWSMAYLWRAAKYEEQLNPENQFMLFKALFFSSIILILQSLVRDAFNDKFIYFAIGYGLLAREWVLTQDQDSLSLITDKRQ